MFEKGASKALDPAVFCSITFQLDKRGIHASLKERYVFVTFLASTYAFYVISVFCSFLGFSGG